MISVIPKSFGHSDVVLRGVMLSISGILEVLTRIDLLKYLINTEEVWVQLWIFLKHKIIDKGKADNMKKYITIK